MKIRYSLDNHWAMMIRTKHEEMERSRKLCGWEPPDQEPGGWNDSAFSTNSVVSEWPTFFGLDTGHFSSSSVPFITCARGSLSAGGCVFSPNTVYTWFDFHHKLASRVILGLAGGPRVDISVPVSQFLLEQVLCHLCAALLQTCQRRGVSICQGDRRLVRG